jgi:hypothetical protein
VLSRLAYLNIAIFALLYAIPETIYRVWKKKSKILIPSVSSSDKNLKAFTPAAIEDLVFKKG